MWKRILLWLLKSVDISVNIEDGILIVQLFFVGVKVFEHEFDVNTVTNASMASTVRSIGNEV